MANKKLSIAIPTFDRATFLEENLNSIVVAIKGFENQVEVIVSDNASSDHTKEVVEKFCADYSWISYHRNEENVVIENFYIVSDLATGEYLWLLGDDDKLEPDAISTILGLIDQSFDLILCNYARWSNDFSQLSYPGAVHRIKHDVLLNSADDVLKKFGLHLGFISSVIVKKEYFLTDRNKVDKYKKYWFPQVYSIFMGIPKNVKFIYISKIILLNRTGNEPPAAASSNFAYAAFVTGPSYMFRSLIDTWYSDVAADSALNQVYTDYLINPFSLLIAAQSLSKNIGIKNVVDYIQQHQYCAALQVLNVLIGDSDSGKSYLWSLNEGGGVFSNALLGYTWDKLGDVENAMKSYERAFIENPRIHPTIVYPLIQKYKDDPEKLLDFIEPKIHDARTYENFAQMVCAVGSSNAMDVLSRMKYEFGESVYTVRAEMAYLVNQGTQLLVDYFNQYKNQNSLFLLAIHLLDCQQIDVNHDIFSASGPKGEYLKKILEFEIQGLNSSVLDLLPIIEDLMFMKAHNLLIRWLPFAKDVEPIIHILKHSPFGELLTHVQWRGNTLEECLYIVERAFALGDMEVARHYLSIANRFYPSVKKLMLEVKFDAYSNQSANVPSIIKYGSFLFPDSSELKKYRL